MTPADLPATTKYVQIDGGAIAVIPETGRVYLVSGGRVVELVVPEPARKPVYPNQRTGD